MDAPLTTLALFGNLGRTELLLLLTLGVVVLVGPLVLLLLLVFGVTRFGRRSPKSGPGRDNPSADR